MIFDLGKILPSTIKPPVEELTITNDSIESIPADIANLKNLRQLRIHGEKITSLPNTIGENLSLTYINLECPKLKTLPDSFANIKTIKEFKFTRCNITAIPAFVCGWTELEKFELSMDNTFQGPYTKLNAIPGNIGNLKKLTYLSIENTYIKRIPDSLGNCPLEYLKLTGDFTSIPETLGNLLNLKTLVLWSYKTLVLPASIGKLSSLKDLDIRARVLKIPESFGKLAKLEKLSIMTDDVTLPKSFGNLRALKDFSADIGKRLPDSIGNCKNLDSLSISSDKLISLPESICKLKKLEYLRLDTFALKTLPKALGNLTLLKHLDIFSGALTSFPESIGNLKKLKHIELDAYNVKELPASFSKLSYIKNPNIEIGKKEPVLAEKKNTVKKGNLLCFEDFLTMSWQYRGEILKSYSLKQLETLIISAPSRYEASKEDEELFKDIMLVRYCKIRDKFKWTEENKKRIAKVSDEFLKAWEDGYAKAKSIIDTLYEKEPNKDDFHKNYIIEIILHPDFLFDDENKDEVRDMELYNKITSYLNTDVDLNIFRIEYDPVTKKEDDFRADSYICRDLSWNIEGFGDIELKDYYICYAIHILYSHNNWAFSDIPKINSIGTEIRVTCDGDVF